MYQEEFEGDVFRVGDRVIITAEDNENYEKFFNLVLEVTHTHEDDEGLGDLYSLNILDTHISMPYSLYSYELREASNDEVNKFREFLEIKPIN